MNGEDNAIPARQRLFVSGGIQAIQKFEAGNLITADDLNEIVQALKELDLRMRQLEEA